METFFLIAPPGLEAIVEREFNLWTRARNLTSLPAPQREKGGVTVELPLGEGFALNRVMKTPSRVLLRLADFRCRDFPKLFKKMRGLDWSRWTEPGGPEPEFHVSSRGSRLAVKRRLEDVCRDGFRAWGKAAGKAPGGARSKQPTSSSAASVVSSPASSVAFSSASSGASRLAAPSIFVRFVDDVCTVSMDTSGEHLHRRGYRLHTPEAPIRENLAASLLWILLGDAGSAAGASARSSSASYKGQHAQDQQARDQGWTLLDPMAGSGTFLLEAAALGDVVTRGFAFESFPCVRSGEVSVPSDWSPPVELPRVLHLWGWDIAEDSLAAARANLDRVGRNAEILLSRNDAFTPEAGVDAATREMSEAMAVTNVAVICNPPYGERLKIEGPLSAYYSCLFQSVEDAVRPERVGFLLPAKARPETLTLPSQWRRGTETRFENGGLPVIFHVFFRA